MSAAKALYIASSQSGKANAWCQLPRAGQPALHLCASLMGKTFSASLFCSSDLRQPSSRKQGCCLWVVPVLLPEVEDLTHDGEVQHCRAHGFKQPGWLWRHKIPFCTPASTYHAKRVNKQSKGQLVYVKTHQHCKQVWSTSSTPSSASCHHFARPVTLLLHALTVSPDIFHKHKLFAADQEWDQCQILTELMYSAQPI